MSVPTNRDEYLKQPNVAVLATVSPSGAPHAVPIWYLYEDGDFVMLASGQFSEGAQHREA